MQSSDQTPPTLSFAIEKMDGLAQGICYENQKITFIPKTLPNEQGDAQIVAQKKGVQFARVQNITTPATNRITPECSHFQQCFGCDYLHTDYDSELQYKQQALAHLLKEFSYPAIEVFAAPKRLGYRNRVQLHYRGAQLGMLDAQTDNIVAIPFCQIAQPAIQQAITTLYQQKTWLKQKQKTGHCEIAWIDNQVKIFWNKPYAYGGFSQVNAAMNQQLCQQVFSKVQQYQASSVLDLFSGDGNLTQRLVDECAIKRTMVDVFSYAHKDFIQLDLWQKQALSLFLMQTRGKQFDCLVIDPPRKGFIALAQWVEALAPKQLLYVSCNAATMVRDIKAITQSYDVACVQLLDMFAATKHFETLVLLTFK